MKRAPLGLGLAALLCSSAAGAYCPSYTLSSSNNTYNCGVEAVNGTNPTPTQWQAIFDVVAKGPPAWGNQGPAVADIGQGCGKPEAMHDVPARFPCELLKAIAMAESGWTQFCVPDMPADQVGGPSRTIISFDCGYGVGQVTSGMHKGETPAFDQKRVAAEPTYNMATGASILASKWRATKCVGDNQPSIVENWYTAVWAYNGLAYSNNPSNPTYSSSRGVYNPAVGGAAPYQEKVFGRVEYPSGNPAYWPSVELAYPNPADVGGTGSPPDLPEPSCASPTDCGNKRSVHTSSCFSTGTGGAGGSGSGGAPAGGGGGGAPIGGGGPTVGGAAGSAGSAGAGALGGFAGGAGAATSGGAPSAGGGPGNPASGDEDDVSGGCACRLKPRPGDASAPLWLGVALVWAVARRRARG
ncbi:MAG: hypothetical protein KJ015_17530 [Myxococcales bacterium]|nr:hypothetical protein [Myxococcales bacterium]